MTTKRRKRRLIGEPVPINSLRVTKTLSRQRWLKLLRSISVGQAQEVNFSRSACRRNIKHFENLGEINSDDYRVIVRTDPENREIKHVYIARVR